MEKTEMENAINEIPDARAWVEIDLDAVKYNVRQIRQAAPGMRLRAVVKANAYGLGAVRIAETLKDAGVDGFCVAGFEEAKELLPLGLPVQILGAVFDFELPEAVASHVILPLTDIEAAERISAEAVRQNTDAECAVKLDTGMGRLGIRTEYAPDVIRAAAALPRLKITGIYSHFPEALATADASAFSSRQMARFQRTLRFCEKLSLPLEAFHMANSDAFLNYPETRTAPFNGMRIGLALYGEASCRDSEIKLKRAVSIRSRLAGFRVLPAGSTVGYNRTCRLERDTLAGTVSIGYADGVPLALSNRGEFLFHGRRCPILGRISMDYTVISLNGFLTDDLRFGEPVTCVGTDRDSVITLEDWASISQTHPYQILTSLNPRVRRIYRENGKTLY